MKDRIVLRRSSRLHFLLLGVLVLLSTNFSLAQFSVANEEESYRRGMTMITPSAQWREGLPSGNGKIGALVYGSISEERVLFNHNELWYGGQIPEVPDMSGELPVVRKMLLDGDYLEANDYYQNKLQEKGFNGKNDLVSFS